MTQPSAAELASVSPNADDVMYTVNTNVVMTALKAADAQSQSPHATTWPREVVADMPSQY